MRFNTENFNPSDEQKEPAQPKRVAIPVDSKVFSQSLQEFESKIAELKKEFQNLFQDRVNVLFGAVPDLEGISIIQYTPYFNDGDVCEFRIGSVSFHEEEDFEQEWDDDFDSPADQQELKDALNEFIYNNQDLMKDMYGDHAYIRITRAGTDISEYEHE